jgi:hypothetical protein
MSVQDVAVGGGVGGSSDSTASRRLAEVLPGSVLDELVAATQAGDDPVAAVNVLLGDLTAAVLEPMPLTLR